MNHMHVMQRMQRGPLQALIQVKSAHGRDGKVHPSIAVEHGKWDYPCDEKREPHESVVPRQPAAV